MTGDVEELVGKTIVRVDDESDERVLFFSDGWSVKLSSDDYLYVELRSPAETRRAAAVAQGKREEDRLIRLRRQEWLSVSCEERCQRRAHDEARFLQWEMTASPVERMLAGMRRDMTDNLRRQSYTLMAAHWDGRPRRVACEACGELECEGASWTRR